MRIDWGIVLVLVVVLLALARFTNLLDIPRLQSIALDITGQSPKPPINIYFYCAGDKQFRALFYAKSIHLALDDGRTFILPGTLPQGTSTAQYPFDSDLLFVIDQSKHAGSIEQLPAESPLYDNCSEAGTNYS